MNAARAVRRCLLALAAAAAAAATTGAPRPAAAQEIQVTGPLAGAPAVRRLRQHRKGRVELAPNASFTLLDEYQRTILLGARLNYNLADWFAIGVWGAHGTIKTTTSLSDQIQDVNDVRFSNDRAVNPAAGTGPNETDRRLTAPNVGQDLKKQLGAINWVIAPQVTFVPFRGKLSLFEKIFVDTDVYFFVGPAFVGLSERENCGPGSVDCAARAVDPTTGALGVSLTKGTESRVAVAPTGGVGISLYTGPFTSVGLEYRALPFAWNTGGFNTRGGPPGEDFPDNKVDDKDRQFKFNQMITLSVSFYLPAKPSLSPLSAAARAPPSTKGRASGPPGAARRRVQAGEPTRPSGPTW